ncbi:hypothetical protein OAW68_08005 [Alphaproteobacteria bacterium]|nr:hypothetical protein [Alphaproteobacteria bacterium]
MFFKYKTIFIILIILLSGCSLNNSYHQNELGNVSILIKTPSDRDNILLRENLKRLINTNQKSQSKYKLDASISYNSSETLSVRGLNVLNSTKATINYRLVEIDTENVIKSGSFNSFPALSSSSSSLYSNELARGHIKDRLNLISAQKMKLILKVTLSRLN